jgi:hypothetical protein
MINNNWYLDGSTGMSVVDLGTAQGAAGATLTTTITVPAGALIVAVAAEVTSASAGSMSDATNGSYTLASSGAMSTAAGFGMVFYFQNSAALSAVTLTYTKQTSGHACSLAAFYVTGAATASALDSAFTNTSAVNSASPTVTSAAAPAGNGEVIIGACAYSNAAAKTLTNTGSFIIPFGNQNGQSTASVGGGHINVGGTLSATFNPTLSGASDNITFILAFKPPSAQLIGWWNISVWTASASHVAGDVLRQNATPAIGNERAFVCYNSTGGTGTTGGSEPSWTITLGGQTTDNTVKWQEITGNSALNGDSATTPTWAQMRAASTIASLGQVIQSNDGTKLLICTVTGTVGAVEPTWNAYTTTGATTTDNGATWVTLKDSSNKFTNWSAPHARLNNAVTWDQSVVASSSHVILAASEHAESQASGLNISFAPVSLTTSQFVYCVDKSNVPPTSADVTTGASIASTGSGNMSWGNYKFFDGLTLIYGGGANGGNITLQVSGEYRNCTFTLNSPGSAQSFFFVTGLGTNYAEYVNCTVNFTHVGDTLSLNNAGEPAKFTNCTFAGTAPTNLLSGNGTGVSNVLFQGCDMSFMGSGKTIVNQGGCLSMVTLLDCKLGSGVTISSALTLSQTQPVTYVVRSDSAADSYRQEKYNSRGSQVVETTIIRTGGASDGVTGISWKLVTTANVFWWIPFECIPITIWNNNTSGTHTVTIFGIWGGGAVPNNDQIWADVEYLGTASFPQGVVATATKVNGLASGAALGTDTSTWGGSTTPFKITISITPTMIGYLNILVKAAKPSTTFYIDPAVSYS